MFSLITNNEALIREIRVVMSGQLCCIMTHNRHGAHVCTRDQSEDTSRDVSHGLADIHCNL